MIVRRWGSSYTGVAGWINIPKRVQFSLWDASDPIIDVRRFAASSTLRHVQGSQGCCGRIYLGRHPQPTTPHQMYSAGRLHLDSLLGPLPQAAAIYRERSPLRFADRIRRPLAVFQGEIDKVVPRHQSDAIVEALLRQHVLFA